MKRLKSELINATIESYLKRRHYQTSEVFCKTNQIHCRTSDEMTLNAAAASATSQDNSIIFSAISIDVAAADQAYQRLKMWVNIALVDKLKMELKGLLYPVFCHLYLEMLHAGNRQAAIHFLKAHQNDFNSETEKDFLEELSSVFSVQDIELRPLVNSFRTRKYKVDMSDIAHLCLQQFLSKQGHITLMQIINTHLTIIKKMDVPETDIEGCEESGSRSEVGINGYVEQPSGTGADREMRELQEAIRLIRNNAHQPLRIFAVNNAIENASSGVIPPNMDKLAVGFSTTEIRLWGINETVLIKPKHEEPSFSFASDNPFLDKFYETTDRTTEGGAVILRGHTDIVHDLRFIPESEILLSVSSDKDMRAWRLNDYTCAAIYSGHSYPIWCMDLSVFNLYVATGSHDRTAKLWSLDRIFPLRIFAGHFLDINCVKFHPNARYLATGSADKTVRLWDKDDGNLLRVYIGAQSTIYSLAFSPDGKYLAAAGDDKSISVWDLATNALLTELKGHEDTVMNLDWSFDGQYIASGSLDGTIRLWPTHDHIKTLNSNSSNVVPEMEPPQIYSTYCSSILSLRYYNKNNSLVCIGTVDNL
ncbi:PREDICTED: TAF5-like RNA polymerase II p300/CBP-associated factor-associated factor 65 kDa subunit 5L [Dufourea novaeangliae]|uniref:TAF5-like RNA polymerase II p300/CBP-associated factor-associated factor 65 kDa subunit 5L n=1 Tax=Dufourea novaeangliae TaxID=178035 RepID=UPI0007674DA2|nr:PREDICTED: TAF5-like RNA polymerase II p300/CBP-associated factor-associated factor 65 kDa subunit 5L [Dufourea novaeangliae]